MKPLADGYTLGDDSAYWEVADESDFVAAKQV